MTAQGPGARAAEAGGRSPASRPRSPSRAGRWCGPAAAAPATSLWPVKEEANSKEKAFPRAGPLRGRHAPSPVIISRRPSSPPTAAGPASPAGPRRVSRARERAPSPRRLGGVGGARGRPPRGTQETTRPPAAAPAPPALRAFEGAPGRRRPRGPASGLAAHAARSSSRPGAALPRPPPSSALPAPLSPGRVAPHRCPAAPPGAEPGRRTWWWL